MNQTSSTRTPVAPEIGQVIPKMHQPAGESPFPEPDRSAITALRRKFEHELFENVIPFWEKYSPDLENGGFFNCLDRDGYVYDTTKHVWLQARQVYMFSKLYRAVESRPAWLEMARLGVNFLRRHVRRDDGRVFFSVTADGRPVSMQRKIFSECFYIMALAEYSRAADDTTFLIEAHEEFAMVWKWAFDLRMVGRPVFEGETAFQNLAIPMILLNLIEVLSDGDTREYRQEISDCIRRMLLHVDNERQVVFENVSPAGDFVSNCHGRHLNPGHAIEAGWFLQHWAQRLARKDLSATAIDMVRWSHDLGWDREFGGLYYFLDYCGFSPTQLEWNMKLWWPHCEAMYGHLLNYSITRSHTDWLRFMATESYAFSHFPDPAHGEWYGYLDRYGVATHRFKGGPYKGCFHVPRALWLCWTLLKRLEKDVSIE